MRLVGVGITLIDEFLVRSRQKSVGKVRGKWLMVAIALGKTKEIGKRWVGEKGAVQLAHGEALKRGGVKL